MGRQRVDACRPLPSALVGCHIISGSSASTRRRDRPGVAKPEGRTLVFIKDPWKGGGFRPLRIRSMRRGVFVTPDIAPAGTGPLPTGSVEEPSPPL